MLLVHIVELCIYPNCAVVVGGLTAGRVCRETGVFHPCIQARSLMMDGMLSLKVNEHWSHCMLGLGID